MADVETSHNKAEHRYEARVDGELAGFIAYEESAGQVNLAHTEVDDRFEGKGVGSALARFALDDLRADDAVRVLVTCPFLVSWIEKHPDYAEFLEG